MRVLVIGGTRFVGPRLVRALQDRGHAVTVFHRGKTPAALPPDVERLRGDRTRPGAIAAALAGRSFDACVDTIAMRGADTAGAIDALDGRVGHYVHFSTGQVYLVRAGCPSPAIEVDYPGPLTPPPSAGAWDADEWRYGIEKRQCEDALAEAWSARGFPATRLRLTMIHGADDPRGRIFAYVLRLRDEDPLLAPEEPSPPIRPIHAGAVVEAVMGILESGSGKGEAYNLAQGESWSHDELVAAIANRLGVPANVVRRSRTELVDAGLFPACAPLAHPWMSVLDPARAARELGFRPGRFDDWLPETVDRLAERPPPAGHDGVRARELAFLRSGRP